MAASSSLKTFGKLWIKPFEEEELIFDGDDDSDCDESACGGAVSNASPMEVNTDSEPDYGYGVHVMQLLADIGADRHCEVAADTEENNVAFIKAQLQAKNVAPLASSCEATGAMEVPANVPLPEIENNSVRAVNNIDDLPPLLEVDENRENDSPSSYSSSSASSDDDSENNSMQTVLEQPLAGTLTSIPEEEEKQQDEQDPLGILPMEIEVERTENEPEGDNEAEAMIAHPDGKANEEHSIDTDSDEIDPIVYLKSRMAERKKLLFRAVNDGRFKNARKILDELVQTSDELNSLLPDYKYNLKLAHTEKAINAYWAERNAKRGRKRKTEQTIRKSGRIKTVKNGTYASL